MEDELGVPHMDGVPGIGSALISGHHVNVLGEHIHDLALAFISPLTTDHDGTTPAHRFLPVSSSKPATGRRSRGSPTESGEPRRTTNEKARPRGGMGLEAVSFRKS